MLQLKRSCISCHLLHPSPKCLELFVSTDWCKFWCIAGHAKGLLFLRHLLPCGGQIDTCKKGDPTSGRQPQKQRKPPKKLHVFFWRFNKMCLFKPAPTHLHQKKCYVDVYLAPPRLVFRATKLAGQTGCTSRQALGP